MLRHLSKTMTAGALAVTLALTGISATATPAAANGHRNNGADAAAVLGGLLLLYGISQVGRNHGTPVHPHIYQHPPRPQVNHRVAPGHCYIEGHNNHGVVRGYRYRCMVNNVSRPNLLPSACLIQVWTPRGHRTIYENQCLAHNGWSPA